MTQELIKKGSEQMIEAIGKVFESNPGPIAFLIGAICLIIKIMKK